MPRKTRDGAESSSQSLESRLWDSYWANRSDENRNALVEHYLPWVTRTARHFVRNKPIQDKDGAVSEVLLAFIATMVPEFRGESPFKGYASKAIKNKVVDIGRAEDQFRARSLECECTENRRTRKSEALIDTLEARPEPEPCHLCDYILRLPNDKAAILWLRYKYGASVSEVAGTFRITPETAKKRIQNSRKMLKELFPSGGF